QGVTFTYTLEDNAGSGRFGLNGSQVVVTNGSALDFETNTSHVIIVRIEDSEHHVQTQNFTITVTDVDEGTAAVTFRLSAATIRETSANGTVVGSLTPDHVPQGVTYTYTLTDNAGGRFALNGSQVVVANGAALDFEANSSHVIRVRIEDSNHNVKTPTF